MLTSSRSAPARVTPHKVEQALAASQIAASTTVAGKLVSMGQGFETHIGHIYISVAMPIVLLGCYLVPPMQVPDEPAHFFRAAQLSDLEIGTVAVATKVGGHIDQGVAQYTDYFCPGSSENLMYCPNTHREQTLNQSGLRAAERLRWSGNRIVVPFQTTVRYAPMFYAPQVLGLALGRLFGQSVHASFILARILNAALAVGITAWALTNSRRGRPLMLAAALFPMTLFEMASVSQDALLLACSFAAVAQVTRSGAKSPRWFWLLAATILLLALSRPPLAALTLLLFLPGWRETKDIGWKHVVVSTVAISALSIAWLGYTNWSTVVSGAVSAFTTRDQASLIISNPWSFFHVVARSYKELGGAWYTSTIGVLGWLNVVCTPETYVIGKIILVLATLTCVFEATANRGIDRFLFVTSAAACVFLILLATYLTWTPVGHPRVEGIQGRYFIGLLPLFAIACAIFRKPPSWLTALRTLCMLACLILGGVVLWNGMQAARSAYPPLAQLN